MSSVLIIIITTTHMAPFHSHTATRTPVLIQRQSYLSSWNVFSPKHNKPVSKATFTFSNSCSSATYGRGAYDVPHIRSPRTQVSQFHDLTTWSTPQISLHLFQQAISSKLRSNSKSWLWTKPNLNYKAKCPRACFNVQTKNLWTA